jgi:septal ring factor EnvC (AmiA/AmiB activator)
MLMRRALPIVGWILAIAVTGLLAWRLPAAMDRDTRAGEVTRLESAVAATQDERASVEADIADAEDELDTATRRNARTRKAVKAQEREIVELEDRADELGA